MMDLNSVAAAVFFEVIKLEIAIRVGHGITNIVARSVE
jgi:hypothetical protein